MIPKCVFKAITFFCVIYFIFNFAFQIKVNANEIYATNYSTQVTIDQNSSASVIITIDLANSQTSELAGGYSLTIPFENITNISTTLNSLTVGHQIRNDSGINILDIDFANQTIKAGTSATLQISFLSNSAIKQTPFGSKEFYIPEFIINHRIDQFSLNLKFNKNLGKPSFITSFKNSIQEDGDFYNLQLSNQKGIHIIWADKIRLTGKNTLTLYNATENKSSTLLNVIPNTTSQKIIYNSIEGSESGLYDKVGNNFLLVEIAPKSEKKVSYSFNMEKSSTALDTINFKNYKTKFDEKTRLGEELLTQISQKEEKIDQLYAVNNLLKQRLNSDISSQQIIEDFNSDLWEKLNKEEKITDLEFSYLVVSICEYLNLETRINYGYLINDYFKGLDTSKPHTWVEVEVDDQVIMLDPFLEKLTGMEYFGLNNSIDRITLGIWHPEEKYNNLLGILEGEIERKMSLSSLEEVKASSSDIGLGITLPENADAGFNFTGKVDVSNNTKYLLPLNSIRVQNKEFIDQVRINQTFYPLLLPGEIFHTEIDGIREDNFFFTGNKTFNVELHFDNTVFTNINSESTVNLSPSNYTIIFIVVLIIVILAITYVIRLRFKYKRKLLVTNSFRS